MDNKEHFAVYNSGYNEGYLIAAQEVASNILRLIFNHPSWMTESKRKEAIADIKLSTKTLLSRKGIIPTMNQVITGKAEEEPLNFDMK